MPNASASQHPRAPHNSAKLGILALLLGLIGSLIAYLGLWIESDMVGLVGFVLVGIALLGAIVSVFWNLAAGLRKPSKDS